MRVADYIFKKLFDEGIDHVFLVVGGGSMFLNDAIKKNKDIKYVCFHHEQAAAIAAEGYFRASGKMAAVCVTSGPGGTNCLTGVLGQWTDSIPVIYISGQVRFETTVASLEESKLRQLGDQEADIVNIVKPIVKKAVMLRDKDDLEFCLDLLLETAKEGRPGPVWLDIPLNIQKDLC